MPLFDDPVRATVGDRPVLWLGTESTADGIYAVIVGSEGEVSAVVVQSVRAGFRHVDGEWIDAEQAARAGAELLKGSAEDPLPTAPSGYPSGTIFDSLGGAYNADGDPL